MPATHTVSVSHQSAEYTVFRNDREEPVIILEESPSQSEARDSRVYVHYVNLDKRHDGWVPKALLQPIQSPMQALGKRKRELPAEELDPPDVEQVTLTEEEYDLQRHKQLNTRRNLDR
jgi:histone acetyltransferase MYST1